MAKLFRGESQRQYRASGTVIGIRSKLGEPGLRVEAWDKDLVFDDFLGEAITDTQGRFTIEFFEDRFIEFFLDSRPDLYFKVFNARTLIHSTKSSVLWNVASNTDNLILEVPDQRSATGVSDYSVSGQVTLPTGNPAAGYTVEALDKDLRTEQALGKEKTDSLGYYRLVYRAEQFVRAEQDRADLKIRVFAPGAAEPVVVSGVTFNAPANCTINIAIPGVAEDEYTRVTNIVTPLLQGQAANGQPLSPTELGDADLDFLAAPAETALDREVLRLWVLALRTAAGPDSQLFEAGQAPFALPSGASLTPTEVEAIFAYGWFRERQPQTFLALVKVPTETLIGALRLAIAQNYIADLFSAIPALEATTKIALDRRRSQGPTLPAAQGDLPSLGDVLNTVSADWLKGVRDRIVDLLVSTDEEDADFNAKAVAKGLGTEEAKLLRRTLRLSRLTATHPPLVKALNKHIGAIANGGTADDSTVKLATVTTADWFKSVGEAGLPGGSNIEFTAYALALERAVEDSHPTATLVDRIDPKRPRFGARVPYAEDVHVFLTATPSFDIVKDSIERQFGSASSPVKESLLPLQRVKRLSASWGETASLIGAGVRTLTHVIDAGPLGLAAMLGGIEQRPRAAELHAAATRSRDSSLVLLANAAPRFNPTSIAKFTPAPAMDLDKLKDYPTIQGLFGDLDSCACQSCGSVLSPAAYLVDLLQFIKTAADAPSSAFAALMQRRPDLIDIELTCENTETELPQLDLVLETLENAVALPLSIGFNDTDDVSAWFKSVSIANAANPNPVRALLAKTVRKLPLTMSAAPGVPAFHSSVGSTAPVRESAQIERRNLLGHVSRVTFDAVSAVELSRGSAPRPEPSAPIQAVPEIASFEIDDSTRSWTVTGAGERWSLVERHGGFIATQVIIGIDGIARSKPVRLPIGAGETSAQWIAALDNGTATAQLKAIIAGLMAATWDYRDAIIPPGEPMAIDVQSIGESWSIYGFRVVIVHLAPFNLDRPTQGANVEIYTQSGRLITVFPFASDWRTISEELARETVPAFILAALPTTADSFGHYIVGRTQIADFWTISSLFIFDFEYRANAIDLVAIAYQSSHPESSPLVEPEYRNPEAYRVLAGALFPWSLPFDLAAEEDRFIFGYLGISRLAIQALLSGPDPWAPTSPVVNSYPSEVLGIQAAEFNLIKTEAVDSALWARWGLTVDQAGQSKVFDARTGEYVEGPPLAVLSRVSILLQQSRLGFEELEDLLQTRFVQSAVATVALSMVPATTCNVSEMTIAGLGVPHLDRLHRIVRLWRHVDWSIYELDLAISAAIHVGANDFASTVHFVAQLRHLQNRLSIPAEILLAWWLPFAAPPHRAHTLSASPMLQGLFERRFQNLSVSNPPSVLFNLDADRSELSYIEEEGEARPIDGEVLRLVAASLGIRPADVLALIGAVKETDRAANADKLTLRSLLRLITQVPIYTALGLSSEHYLYLVRLLGKVPGGDFATVEQHADLAQAMTGSGFALGEAAWLLLQDERAAGDVVWSAARRTALLSDIGSTLRSLASQIIADRQSATPGSTSGASQALELSERLQEALLKELAASFGSDQQTLKLLLSQYMTYDADPSESVLAGLLKALPSEGTDPPATQLDRAIQRVQKATFILTRSAIGSRTLQWLQPVSTLAAAPVEGASSHFDVNDLFERLDVKPMQIAKMQDLQAWRRLLAVRLLRTALRGQDGIVDAYLLALGKDPERARQQLASATKTTLADIVKIVDSYWKASDLEPYRNPIAVSRLVEALLTFQVLGLDANGAGVLADSSDNALSRKVLFVKLGSSAANAAIMRINESLLIRQRNALVDLLVHRKSLRGFEQLYEHYLIDTQVSAAPKTTRLLQATQSVQQFVNRCLLNQEAGLALNTIQHSRWGWMSVYRVWEANRKVFLYPENWIYPELRDDATEAFKKAESALTQGDANAQNAALASQAYVEDALEVSRVQVLGMHVDRPPTSPDQQILYAVGRSLDEPHQFFWRKCERFAQSGPLWSGWESIGGGISGDHVAPFMLNGNPAVAWCTFEQTVIDTFPYLKGNVSWVSRGPSGWTKAATIKDVVAAPVIPGKDVAGMIALRIRPTLYSPQMSLKTVAQEVQSPIEIPEIAIYVAADRAVYSGGASDLDAEPADPKPNMARQIDGKAIPGNRVVQLSIQVLAVRVYANGLYDPISDQKFVTVASVGEPAQLRAASTLKMTEEERGGYANEGALGSAGTAGGPSGYDGTVIDRGPPKFPSEKKAVTNVDGVASFPDLFPIRVGGEIQWVPIYIHTRVNGVVYGALVDLPSDAKGSFSIQLTLRIDGGAVPTTKSPSHAVDEPLLMRESVCIRLLPHSPPNVRPGTLSKTLGCPFGMYSWGSGFRGFLNSTQPIRDGASGTDLALLGATQGDVYVSVASDKEIALGDLRAIYYHDQQLSTWITYRDQSFIAITDGSFALREVVYSGLRLERLWTPEVQAASDSGSYWSGHIPAIARAPWSPASITEEAFHFDPSVPYSIYNWEVFYHLPSLIADHLHKQQRFADADAWLRQTFDPMTADAQGDVGEARHWRFLPFRRQAQPQSISALLEWLANPSDMSPGRMEQQHAIDRWKDRPFRPHDLARARIGAYQWRTAISYIQNLLDWGDQLFARDSREAINEATQLYVLAGQILGPRPKTIRRVTDQVSLTFRSGTWDANFSNSWETLADHLMITEQPGTSSAFDVANRNAAPPTVLGSPAGDTVSDTTHVLSSLGVPYFCIPANDSLLSLWDRAADRLVKIRLGQNIEGLARDLALFDPPIDPAILVRATAAGLDVGDILAGLNAPRPTHRFQLMTQKAMELCAEVKALGGMLLSAVEKRDAEALSDLRAVNEVALLEMVVQLRVKQLAEAKESTKTLADSRKATEDRFNHLQAMLGRPDVTAPARGQTLPMGASSLQLARDGDLSGNEAGLGLIRGEQDQIARLVEAHIANTVAGAISDVLPILLAGAALIPAIAGSDLGASVERGAWGLERLATTFRLGGEISSGYATRDAIFSSFQRRKDDWIHQSNQAIRDLAHIDQQLAVSEIHEAIAQAELGNTNRQIEQSRGIADFLKSKFTNQQLYSWMESQIATVFFQAYRLAHDAAVRAEASFNYELTGSVTAQSAPFIRPGYWDSLKRGLLAGETLSIDLNRMEMSYLERNRREFEITKHVSLRRLDPEQLKALRETGSCEFDMPEWLFDLDCPGQYLRRLRSVSLTIPCVVGPYTGVHCKLTLISSAIRSEENTSYPANLIMTPAAMQALVTSSGSNDGGLFETNLRDDRYLPFEGAGAISRWRLELLAPLDLASFDYGTIPDVIIHLRFVAFDGGPSHVGPCKIFLDGLFKANSQAGPKSIPVLFAARADFPSEWARAISSKERLLSVTVTSDFVPYWARQFSSVKGQWIEPQSKIADGKLPMTFDLAVPKDASEAWLLLQLSRSGTTPPPFLEGNRAAASDETSHAPTRASRQSPGKRGRRS